MSHVVDDEKRKLCKGKNKGNKLFGTAIGIIFALIFVLKADTCFALEPDNVVKVGINRLNNYISYDNAGNPEGYLIEYLEKISKYTGWEYEYVYFDNYMQEMESIKNKTIDFALPIQENEEYKQYAYFSEYPIGIDISAIYVQIDDDRYYHDDYENFNGMKIAIIKEGNQNELLDEYAQRYNFSYIPIEYSTYDEVFQALEKKEVDAIALGGFNLREDYRNICQFSIKPLYISVVKEKEDLLESLNDALGKIETLDNGFDSDLYDKYFIDTNYEVPISLTRKEAEYIENSDEITVGFIPSRAPFSYMDEKDIKGILPDVFEKVEEKSGLKFKYEMLEDGEKSIEYLESNPDAVVVGVTINNLVFTKDKYIVSDNVYTDNIGFVGKKGMEYNTDSNASYKLAISKGYTALGKYLEAEFPNYELIYCNTTQECIDSVLSGKADLMSQNINVITPLLAKPRYEELTLLPTFLTNESIGAVMLKSDEHKILIDIFNKCMATISDREMSQYAVNHMVTNGYRLSWSDWLYKFRYPFSAIIILVFALLMMMYIYTLSKKNHLDVLEMKNRQLNRAIDEANQANEAKGRFLAQMSHEIRTPMNAIIALTELAGYDIDNPQKMSGYLTKIDGASKLLLGIINDILDMSAIESNKLKIANTSFNFKNVIEGVTSIYYQQCKDKGIEFNVFLKDVTEEEFIGDPLRLNQIIMNLMSNALKFTPQGGKIDFVIVQTSKTDDKVCMRISVSDTGCGMSDDLKSRLFQPFEQEDANTARKYGGSGLGLSIAKRLTDMMNGKITVESELGKGTTFTVDIPFGRIEENVQENKEKYDEIKVLVIDDNEESCSYTCSLLENMSIRNNYVASGEEALEELADAEDKGDAYSICMLDHKFAKNNIMETIGQIRSLFGNDTIVIIVSAYDINEIEDEAKDAGANYIISKPLFKSSLYSIFDKIAADKDENDEKSAKTEGVVHFENKHVLIAEDVALNMEVAVKLLEIVGIEADSAYDGQQAVDMFEKASDGYYDAILLDINMPVLNGFESAEKIRKSSKVYAQTVPIYAMTAHAFSDDVTKCFDAGMNGHIAKPIETSVLYDTLENAFNQKEA